MHIEQVRIRNTVLYQEEFGTALAAETLKERALNLYQGEVCYKKLDLACAYYLEHKKQPEPVTDDSLEKLIEDKAIIKEIETCYRESRFPEILSLVEKLSTQEYGKVQYILARMSYKGRGVPQDFKAALERHTIACSLGYAFSYEHLSNMYKYGEGTEKDLKKAVSLLEIGAVLGNPKAYYILSGHYADGDGVEQDCDKAFQYIKEAIKTAHPNALYEYARMHERGMGTPKNLREAARVYEIALGLGSIDALQALASLYLDNPEIYDPRKAIAFLKRSASNNNVHSIVRLAKIYHKGIEGIIERSLFYALEYYDKAASLGDRECEKIAKEIRETNPCTSYSGKTPKKHEGSSSAVSVFTENRKREHEGDESEAKKGRPEPEAKNPTN